MMKMGPAIRIDVQETWHQRRFLMTYVPVRSFNRLL